MTMIMIGDDMNDFVRGCKKKRVPLKLVFGGAGDASPSLPCLVPYCTCCSFANNRGFQAPQRVSLSPKIINEIYQRF